MSKLSNLMSVLQGRENILELYWLYCVGATITCSGSQEPSAAVVYARKRKR